MTMMTVAACLWVGLFPLLQFGTYSTITRDKWLIMLILFSVTLVLAIVSFIVWCFRLSGQDRAPAALQRMFRPRLFQWHALALGAALAQWMIVSCMLSPLEPNTWLIGASTRREGLLTQLCYVNLFLVFACCRVRKMPVLYAAAGGVLVFFTVVVYQRAGINVFGLYPKGTSYQLNPEFQGTIGNVDMDTGYLCLMAGLFLTELINRFKVINRKSIPLSRRIWPAVVLSVAFAFSVSLIVTMGVQFGVIALGVLALISVLRLFSWKIWLPLLVVIIVLVLIVVWVWPMQGGGVWELHEMMHGRVQLSFGSNRVAVWVYSMGLARESLLTGGGSDTFVLRFNEYIKENKLVIPDRQGDLLLPHYFDNPHNEYIAHLVNHGLPAVLLFIGLIVFVVLAYCLSPSRRREKRLFFPRDFSPFVAAVICFAVQAFFSFSVPLVAPMFWVVMGIAVRDQTGQ